ncbi:MAG: hypothetical protein ACETWG_06715 [Candidatus Neomarinimicrobiota bacterium]
MKTTAMILFILAVLLGCEAGEESQEVTNIDYFPLNIGGEYRYYHPPDTTIRTSSKVWGTVLFGNKKYYAVGPDSLRVNYYRPDPVTGNIYIYYEYITAEELLFRFNLAEGDTYHVYSNLNDLSEFQIVTVVNRNETVETLAGTFTNCLFLAFDTPEVWDDAWWFWFARGVGIVQYDGDWSPLGKLAFAQVGGSTYQPGQSR